MFLNQRLVRREIDAVDLVVGDEAVDPLNFWAQLAQGLEGLERGVADFGFGQLRCAGDSALDDELRHVSLLSVASPPHFTVFVDQPPSPSIGSSVTPGVRRVRKTAAARS